MAARGVEASETIHVSCGQGSNVNATFALRNGRALSCDFRDDPKTREMVEITEWEEFKPEAHFADNMHDLAVEILQSSRLKDAFDRAVLAYFDFHLRRDDRPLPPR